MKLFSRKNRLKKDKIFLKKLEFIDLSSEPEWGFRTNCEKFKNYSKNFSKMFLLTMQKSNNLKKIILVMSKHYDLIIIGSGGGTKLRPAVDLGKKVAIIEKDELGGTCLNRGCIPSKMLIHTADLMKEINEADRFNLEINEKPKIHFEELVKRVNEKVNKDSKSIEDFYKNLENLDYYKGHARFIGPKKIKVNDNEISADKIVIATGSRPKIPNIHGLASAPFLTSKEALKLDKLPSSMVIIGVGYIGLELGHFFSALGTKVTFLGREHFLKDVDQEISTEFYKDFSRSHDIRMKSSIQKVTYDKDFKVEYVDEDNNHQVIKSEQLLIATGVKPNSDDLGLENTQIKITSDGYIKTNKFLQTDQKGVYAIGDVNGHYFFRHSVNFEGEYLLQNIFTEKPKEIIYPQMPFAMFTNPQIAGVGPTEEELIEKKIDYFVGKNYYKNSAMGDALRSEFGLVKLIFERQSEKLLAAHIVGEEASNMIHMCIAFHNMEANLSDFLNTIFVHPALPENIRNAARNAEKNFS